MTEDQLNNLKKLVEAKSTLIRHAFQTENTDLTVTDDKIIFPWFQTPCSSDEAFAYTTFVGKLCEMVRKQKRITATEKEVDNEKYAFRCFLLRLGLIGKEYKMVRKILLRNLSGSSAFKSGKKPEPAGICRCSGDRLRYTGSGLHLWWFYRQESTRYFLRSEGYMYTTKGNNHQGGQDHDKGNSKKSRRA